MTEEKNVRLLTPEPEPGQCGGPERYLACDFCGFKGAPTADRGTLDLESQKHGAGVCA